MKNFLNKTKRGEHKMDEMNNTQQSIESVLKELTQVACRLGANDAQVVSTAQVSVEDSLANICRESPEACYGLSVNCPPHVSGPPGFRELLKNYDQALIFKIDVPTEVFMSEERWDVFRKIQEIAAGIEASAVEMGAVASKAFAGSSCKLLFCQDYDDCRVLAEGKECRYPQKARPSMSGFGINVGKLMEAAGWRMDRITRETDPNSVPMGMVCGMVLVG
jgi:predicted metal-binding protein